VARRPILLLVNPVAGGKPGSGPGLAEDASLLTPVALRAALTDRGLEVDLHELQERDDAGILARQAADDGRDVVVGGGDGTVSAVATSLIGHPSAALGILAMGSFNNIARGFGVPATLDAALDVIAFGEATRVDTGVAGRAGSGGTAFFEAGGVGLDAFGFLAAELAGRRRWWSAVRAAWRGVARPNATVRITIDGKPSEGRTAAVIVSNGPFHGAGFAVASNADPTDGLLNVTAFARMSRLEVLIHLIRVSGRRRRWEPRITAAAGRRVTIEGPRRTLPAHADGQSIGTTPVIFEVRPGSLRLLR
jgi:diacylglycerol kinase family enzyme